ncbi:carboxypeptidase-like regulatory domain-containing protein [Flavisericum labens]|uniref:carboxypeptidase-like regulatory domain-containing protein n=1 Tax=Flavisericum labens TaxID=3377112 RepID=UPI00387AD1BF
MKHLLYIIAFLIAPFCYSQDTGIIVGKVLDAELKDSPLVMAEVSLKGTDIKSNTDLSGMFVLENLKSGDYTLVYTFVGYETKEVKVHVDAFNPVELKLALEATQVSMDDITLAMAMANSENGQQNTSEQ